jgi:DNA-binding transcriptional LysR family regulator
MERPTLRQLEIFAEIVRAGTFRGAARALGLSQVAISDHVRQLERRLGCSLFLRSAGGKPSLTRAGQTVLDHGRNVLFACDALIAAARSEAGEEGSGAAAAESSPIPPPAPVQAPAPPEAQAPEPEAKKEKPITIAGHPSILARFQDQLAAAEEAFPDRPITVDFAIFTAGAAHSALNKGLADIALFYSVGDTPDFPSDYLWSEQWSLLAKADHPLVQREALTRADCVDMPVVMLDPANPLRGLCEASLEKAGLWPSPTVLETDDYARIAAELDLGEAIFTAFGVSAAQFAARAGVKRLPLAEPLPSVEVRRAIGPGADDDPTIAALAGLLN